MAIYIIGDIHLHDPKENIDWSYNHKGLFNFIRSLQLTSKDLLIQCGDLFHKTMARGATNKSAGRVAQYVNDNISFAVFLQGNHDISKYSGSNLETIDLYEKILITKDINIFEWGNKRILLLPYIEGLKTNGPYEEKVKKMVNGKKVDYIIGHHFFKENAIADSPYLDINSIGIEFEWFIQGHNHKFERFKQSNKNDYICIGSMSPISKDQASYKFSYLKIDDEGLSYNKIEPTFFSQFVSITWDTDKKISIEEKDFALVKCSCKKEEKYLKEQEIRKSIPNNLYEIDWDITDDIQGNQELEVTSDSDLVGKFFEENEYSKDIKDIFYSYYTK